MDTYKAIISKRDTRAYLDRPIPDEIVHRILNAGRMAGSSKNSQPCRFIVMRDRVGIERLAACGDFTAPMRSAPLVVAILLQEGWRPFDVGRAAQNMMLAAWNEGITSCPVGIQRVDEGRKAVGAPDEFEVHMVVCFGYPDPSTPLSRGQSRRRLDELVHWERW
ncbi:MAG TPA: nitroreductase [Dehalococcoidia bacterium]|nr:nitroreductase [Dehalococcoidia bacterium]